MRQQLTAGCQCVRCMSGTMQVRSVYGHDGWHTRYLICSKCGCRDQQILKADEVRRRKTNRRVKQKSGSA